MIDKIIELIKDIWETIVPWITIMDFQNGVMMRNGKFKKVLKAGTHLKIPVIDHVIVEHVAITTVSLPAQSLTTKDGKTIVTKGMVRYHVDDAHAFCIKIWDAKDALVDTSCGIIHETVNQKTWAELRDGKVDSLISRRIKDKVKDYGVNVDWVTLTDMAEIASIRLIGNQNLTD